MNLPLFLSDLHRRGIRLSADGDRLRCHAPAGVLTAAVTEELQRNKREILAFLGAAQAVAHHPAIVPLQSRGTRPAVFAVAGHNGDVFAYRELTDALGPDQPFFGLQPPGLDHNSVPMQRIEHLAAYFADQIAGFDRRGPHIVAGYCAGGTVAFELARQLHRRGVGVEFLAMFACPYPSAFSWAARMSRRVRDHVRGFSALATATDRSRYVADFARRRAAGTPPAPVLTDPVLLRRAALEKATVAAVLRYEPQPFNGRLRAFLPNPDWADDFQTRRWHRFVDDADEHEGPQGCDMPTMLRAPYCALFAEFFRSAAR